MLKASKILPIYQPIRPSGKQRIHYDALSLISDGLENNSFIGSWTSYSTGTVLECHWGDNRIPDCGDLDIGAAFSLPDEKCIQYGWESYLKTNYGYDPNDPEAIQAREKEERKWWE